MHNSLVQCRSLQQQRFSLHTECVDSYGRTIDYLRISLTDRCNMRCVYCVPSSGKQTTPLPNILSNDELIRILQAAASVGFRKVRLTGGEPTLRPGLVELVRAIKAIPGIEYLMMTTNAVRLSHLAVPLKEAGLDRVNISIDSLKPDRLAHMTGGGSLAHVWAGIEAADRAGLHPIRLNTVIVHGMNDDEIIPFATLSTRYAWEFRFIEMMPHVGVADFARDRVVPSAELIERIENVFGPLELLEKAWHDPASYYRISGAQGKLGFISSVSEPFCSTCNRMRLTADGRLHLCLLCDEEVDLRLPLRRGDSHDDLAAIIRDAILKKPIGHALLEGRVPTLRSMTELGG